MQEPAITAALIKAYAQKSVTTVNIPYTHFKVLYTATGKAFVYQADRLLGRGADCKVYQVHYEYDGTNLLDLSQSAQSMANQKVILHYGSFDDELDEGTKAEPLASTREGFSNLQFPGDDKFFDEMSQADEFINGVQRAEKTTLMLSHIDRHGLHGSAYDWDTGEGFVVMRYRGKPLNAIVLSEAQIPACLRQVTRRVARLHENGVVHCDLKMQNILFFKVEKVPGFKIYLIDFAGSHFELNKHYVLHSDTLATSAQEHLAGANMPEYKPEFTVDILSLGLVFARILGVPEDKLDWYKTVEQRRADYEATEQSYSDDGLFALSGSSEGTEEACWYHCADKGEGQTEEDDDAEDDIYEPLPSEEQADFYQICGLGFDVLIRQMLARDPKDRPTIKQVQATLEHLIQNGVTLTLIVNTEKADSIDFARVLGDIADVRQITDRENGVVAIDIVVPAGTAEQRLVANLQHELRGVADCKLADMIAQSLKLIEGSASPVELSVQSRDDSLLESLPQGRNALKVSRGIRKVHSAGALLEWMKEKPGRADSLLSHVSADCMVPYSPGDGAVGVTEELISAGQKLTGSSPL